MVLALTFMHDKISIDVNMILRSVQLKIKPNKEHILHFLLFYFHQKKNVIDARRIICKIYIYINVIVIRTCVNWFKWFKNDDFNINDKECSVLPREKKLQLEEDELQALLNENLVQSTHRFVLQ